MRFYADLHVHSKHSVATSKNADLEGLARWARLKGVRVVGTGDFTHPAWWAELEEKLVPAEPGLYRLKPEIDREVRRRVPEACRQPVRFALQVEISTIYKRAGRTRKIHHLVYAGEKETAARFREALGRVGNIASDGRPILGLDSRHLLETVLESGPDAFLVPAHAWTPWFAVLGSRSGFDSVEACYGDLAGHISAVETGLSSDPPMNWRVSDLDRFQLVSNSDAHSPRKLAREACVMDTELEYDALRTAIETGEGLEGTVEFHPEEGKYHLDGHRKCGVRLEPEETRELDGRCPECGDPVTVGVMHRVEELADRPEGAGTEGRAPYTSLVPLPEIVSEVRDVGVDTETVRREAWGVLRRLGPELAVLADLPLEEVEAEVDPLLAEAIGRLRAGEVRKEPGYDGEFGVIRLFEPDELQRQPSLGGLAATGGGDGAAGGAAASPSESAPAGSAASGADGRRRGEPVPDDDAAVAGGAGGAGVPGERAAAAGGAARAAVAAGEGAGGRVGRRRPRERRRASGNVADSEILASLDPDQRAAAEIVDGPLLVVAGPGAGKTRTLTHRLAHLVDRGEEEPERCLTLTFTRRAAAEMRERLEELVPGPAGRIPVTTFHGLGHALLREWRAEAGYGEGLRVVDEREARELAREVFDVGRREARGLLDGLARARRREAAPDRATISDGRIDDESAREARAAELDERRRAWEEALRERGLVDFDGLLAHPVRLLDGRRDLREACRERWPRISIDEYQDIDALQHRLVRHLAPEGADLCAIGDPDQSIYGFRGARVGFFLRFRRDWPDARVVRLERNYRSSPAIVEAARQAIRPASLAGHRPLRPTGAGGGGTVVLQEAPTAAAEAESVVHTIERLMGGTSYFSMDSGRVDATDAVDPDLSFSDFAVLYRTRAQEPPLVEALARSGIPFQRRSHRRLREHASVRRLLEELREVVDGDGAVAPGPGDGEAAAASEPGGPDGDGLRPLLDRAVERVREQEPGARSGDGDAAGGGDGGPAPEAGDVDEALDLLEPVVERHADDPEGFLDELALGAEVDAWDPRADRVSLLTLHAAKGLEFPVVFVTGCEDGLMPLRWGGDDPADPEEERRLLFVGMTRAGSRLYLTRAERRTWRGEERSTELSPFLRDVGDRLLERRRAFAGARGAAARGDGREGPDDGAAADREQLSLL